MKHSIRFALPISFVALFAASAAYAHSGPGAVHNFGFWGAIHHILTSPDHLLPFVLAITLGVLDGSRALKAQNSKMRRPDDDD